MIGRSKPAMTVNAAADGVKLTPAQRTTLTHLREAGLAVGDTFCAHDYFGARDAADNAHRRTLTALRAAGVLGQGEPAWATNAYRILPETYQALERERDRGWSR